MGEKKPAVNPRNLRMNLHTVRHFNCFCSAFTQSILKIGHWDSHPCILGGKLPSSATELVCLVAELVCFVTKLVCFVTELLCFAMKLVCFVAELVCNAAKLPCSVIKLVCLAVKFPPSSRPSTPWRRNGLLHVYVFVIDHLANPAAAIFKDVGNVSPSCLSPIGWERDGVRGKFVRQALKNPLAEANQAARNVSILTSDIPAAWNFHSALFNLPHQGLRPTGSLSGVTSRGMSSFATSPLQPV